MSRPSAGPLRSKLRGRPSARCCWQALRSAPTGLRSGPASHNISVRKERKEVPTFQQLSGIMVVVDRKE